MIKRLRIKGECDTPQGSELIVATDASVQDNLHSGAFISTAGKWGIDAAIYAPDICQPQCVAAMEMRAAWYGLRRLAVGTDVVLLTDSETARWHMQAWKEGSLELPPWYNTRARGYHHPEGRPTLAVLQERMQTDAEHITVEHVRGHAGHLLNEAADGLAGIGLNYLREVYDKVEAERRSASLAASFLLSYSQQAEL